MSENPFKDHSISAIEACVAKALTELVGKEVTVGIAGLQVSGEVTAVAEFNVRASHEIWVESMRAQAPHD